MSSIDYAAMSYQELRGYFLSHRQDQAALQAYGEKCRARLRNVITTVAAPDFNHRIRTAFKQQVADYQCLYPSEKAHYHCNLEY